MLILSVDTSCNTSQAALTDGGKVLAEIALNNKKTHSVKVMPMIKQLLDDCGKTLPDIDAFACVNGPGSYTGLRIGVSTCKLLAYTAERPVITVKTPDFLAWSAGELPENTLICSCIDARNTQIFYGLYRVSYDNSEYKLTLVNDYGADAADAVCKNILETAYKYNSSAVYFTGDGAVANEALLRNLIGESLFRLVRNCNVLGRAAAIGETAENIYNRSSDKSVFSADNADVFYLRTPKLTIKNTAVN